MRYGLADIPGLGAIPYQLFPTNPSQATAATVGLMQVCIREALSQPAVVAAAYEALGSVPFGAPAWRKAQAVWEWVHRNVRFMSDEEILARYFGLPEDVELLQRPELLVLTRRGDCDCFTMLTCALLSLAGVIWRIVTVKADPRMPDRWSHVYAAALTEAGEEIPMDTSHGRFFGEEVPASRVFARAEWSPNVD